MLLMEVVGITTVILNKIQKKGSNNKNDLINRLLSVCLNKMVVMNFGFTGSFTLTDVS